MIPAKILMTADAAGGVWNYSVRLAKALAGYDVRMDLATMGPPPSDSQKQEAETVSGLTLHQSTYKLEWMEDPWDDIARAGQWLLRLERQLEPDLVHLNSYAHGALPWASPVCLVAHSCVLSWWNAVHHEPAPASWSRYRVAVAEGIRRADYLIAPSIAMLRALRAIYGQLAPSSVVYNGASAEEYSLAQKQGIIFTAGRLWDKGKNIEMVMRAAAGVPWQFLIAGQGNPDVSPSGNVSLLGRVSAQNIAEYMAVASIYCLPALYEPFGLSILEAALSGCALVLGDICSLRELWDGAAVFVRPDDHAELSRTLTALIDNSGRRRELARLARQRGKVFSLNRMAGAYLGVYERLLERSGIAISPEKTCA